MSGHVFISHGSDDSEEANALAAFIEGKGVHAWIAPRDVRPGQDYSEQLQAAIETCLAFVVLVTDKANRSPYVRAETEMAFSTAKPIFPVRTGDIQPAAGLAFFLKIRHWTDAFGPGREASLTRLARELQALAGVPVDDAPPTSPPVTSPPIAAVPPAAEVPSAPPPAPSPPLVPAPAALMAKPAPADESLRTAAIGPNAAYYLDRWRQMDERGSTINWNWPASLANVFWFAYRKMWLPMMATLVVLVLLSLVGAADPALGKPTLLLSVGISFITGGFGNHLYRKQTEKLIAETAALDGPARVAALESRGGVSKPALYVLLGLVLLLTLLAMLGAARQMREQQGQGPDNMLQLMENGFAPQPGQDGGKPPLTEDEIRSLEQQGY